MNIIRHTDPDFREKLASLFRHSSFSPETDASVAAILADVKANGDEALVRYAEKFDHIRLAPSQFLVAEEEFAAAEAQVSDEIRQAILTAHEHIVSFSSQHLPKEWSYEPRPGVTLGEKYTPIDKVGCYIPGGTAPLISTVLHTVTMAKVAGCSEISIVTPPGKDGKVNPAILFASRVAGATRVYRLGGVYGVAALAYGTKSVSPVEKIVGPGNAYVTSAKRQLYGTVALDLVAGPSEILVLADQTARPDFIAADLLSQAEHGSGLEQAVLVTTDESLLERVASELEAQSQRLPRIECIRKVLERGVFLIWVPTLAQAAEIASSYAPEHLELITENPEALVPSIKAAGAIFLGPWTPEPVGDFVAGPSHVLPTGGSARYFSGLTVDMFFRRSSLVKYSKEAILTELPHIAAFAKCEGLDGHGNSAIIRSK